MAEGATRRREYAVCLGILLASLAGWFSPYLLRGYTFLHSNGHLLWVDWVLARKVLFSDSGISEWNPYVLFGVDWVGREAFLNPLNLGSLVGYLLPGDKFSFMAATLLFLTGMGLSMYTFLRALAIRPAFARIGTIVYLLASKWADDAYHGPRFVAGYAVLPLLLLLILRMHATGFRYLRHFVIFGALISLDYLGLGASFLLMQAYLVGPFFFYMLYRRWREAKESGSALWSRTAAGLGIALPLAAALSAYILLPFLQNFLLAERSRYGEGPGWGLTDYTGLVFPWLNRIYTPGPYDLHYPFPFNNLFLYVGILAVPALVMGFARRLWTPVTGFFAVAFLAWLALWNKYVIAVFPLIPWIDRLTQGNPSQYQGHIILITSMSVVLPCVLQGVCDRRENIWRGRGGAWLGWFNRVLIAVYLAAAAAFAAGALVFGTELRNHLWSRLTVGHFLLIQYYFLTKGATFIAIFLIRAAILWIYHRRHFLHGRGQTLLLVLMIADFLLVFQTEYPWRDLEDRYSMQRIQNRFVVEKTGPLDRLGAAHYQRIDRVRMQKLKQLVWEPAPADYAEVQRRLEGIFDGGYRWSEYEPSQNNFPIIAGRALYAYHESIMPSWFWEYDQAMNREAPDYWRQSFIGVWDPHSALLDVAGVNYLFWHEEIRDPRLTEVARYNNTSRIYRNRRAAPRVYLVSRVEHRPTSAEVMERLRQPTFPFREVAVTEDRRLYEALKAGGGVETRGEARITTYAPDRIAIATQAPAQRLLVLNDMYHPNWSVRVNGSPAVLYRVNGVFRGVLVPAGDSVVEFRYRNRAFEAGLWISVLSWLAVGGGLILTWRRR